MDFSRSNVLHIFIGVIFIFALIIFMDIINFNLNTEETNKKVVQIVNIEALQNNNDTNTTINLNPVSDFCKSSSDSLKTSCSKLTKKNCNTTTCCVMLNGEKCVAGNQDGPTFKTESGEDINIDYYYYQNKCYGNSCPTK
jgi:archaellum component FlaF (FlaF/FlaG flagellin family)